MIELTVLRYLSEQLDVPVYMEEPENPPAAYVILEKTGSATTNHIETAMLAVQSYGATLYEAAVLNNTVKKALEAMISLSEVSAVRHNSDYNFTDPATKRYRYQCVYSITFYEEDN